MDNTKANLHKLIRVFKDNWHKFLLFITTGAVSNYLNNLANYQVRLGQADKAMSTYAMFANSAFMLSIIFLYGELLLKDSSKISAFLIGTTKVLVIICIVIPFLWDYNILPYPLF